MKTDFLKLDVTQAAAPHLVWAVETHNEAVEAGEVKGSILKHPDPSVTRKQIWTSDATDDDANDLVMRLTDDLKRISEATGQSYPVAARHLAKEIEKLHGVVTPKAKQSTEKKDENMLPAQNVQESPPAFTSEDFADLMAELDSLDENVSFIETDSSGNITSSQQEAEPASETAANDEVEAEATPEIETAESAPQTDSNGIEIPDTLNPIMESPSGIISLIGVEKPWELARDCVNYPIEVKPLFFEHNGAMEPAESSTNSGRPTKFFGAAVDRNRTGNMEVISTVTDKYGLMMPVTTYQELEAELSEMEMEVTPQSVYVSNDGGRQILTLDINDMLATNCRDKIRMAVELITSVDGKKKHHMRLVAHNIDTGSEVLGLTSQSFNLSTRHTASINDRHIAFQATIGNMIKSWNDEIAPMMALMMDTKFDRGLALDMLEKIMEKAEIPELHRRNAAVFYTSDNMSTQEKEHSMYRVVTGMSEYLTDALEDKPERLEKFRENLAKKSWKLIQNTIDQMRKHAA